MRIQLLSEGGGLGDILRRIGLVHSIKEAIPDANVTMVVRSGLEKWARLDPIVDGLVLTHDTKRRDFNEFFNPEVYQYLSVNGPFDATVDAYDPAETWENSTTEIIDVNRGQTWRKSASIVLRCPLKLRLPVLRSLSRVCAAITARLQSYFKRPLSFLVGLHPRSYWRWRSISREQVFAIVGLLKKAGAQVVLFHHRDNPVGEWARELGVAALIGETPEALIEAVRLCDGFVGVDSGLFHVAGMTNVPTVGAFAQTNGVAIGRDYPSCYAIVAGTAEREGLNCTSPCYRRKKFGCNRAVCGRDCRAIQRIDPKVIVDKLLALIVERRGIHLPAADRVLRLFGDRYATE